MKYFSLDETNVLRIIVTNINGDDIITTKENLRSPNNPYVGWIPRSVPEYKQSAKTLSEKDIEKIMSPKHLSPLQQEFLSVHYKLNHLPFTIMLRLSNMSILPRRFLKLRNDLPPCVSCMLDKLIAACGGTNHPLRQPAVLSKVQKLPSPGSELAQIRLCRLNQGLIPG